MNNIETTDTKIVCDTKGCSYEHPCDVDPVIWINKPCPNCSANLLTQENYDGIKSIMDQVDYINMLEMDLEDLPNKRYQQRLKVGPTGEVTFKEVKEKNND